MFKNEVKFKRHLDYVNSYFDDDGKFAVMKGRTIEDSKKSVKFDTKNHRLKIVEEATVDFTNKNDFETWCKQYKRGFELLGFKEI